MSRCLSRGVAACAKAALFVWLLACTGDTPPAATTQAAPPVLLGVAADSEERAVRARRLMERFQCNRCHEGTGLPVAAPTQHCVQCHRAIRDGSFEAPPEQLAIWREHATSLLVTPDLAHIGKRLRRSWVRAFLLRPHDVRPHLPANMPRLALSEEEAQLLAEQLVPEERDQLVLTGANPERGARTFASRGCASCHSTLDDNLQTIASAASVGARPWDASAGASDARALAPDLTQLAERVQPGRLIPWLLDPAAQAPGTLMPNFALTAEEALDLAAFLLGRARPRPPARALEPRLPVLRRKVRFAEVNRRVFHNLCWHCHSAPDYARGDGGPGNSGGFGFVGRGLDLSSHAGLAAGSRDERGRRRSLFTPLDDGTPRLIAHLLARRAEERGLEVPGVRGMPLAFPALSLEDIQLVESWIVQGRSE